MPERTAGSTQRTAEPIRPGTGPRPVRTASLPRAALRGQRQTAEPDWRSMLGRAWQATAPGASRVRITARGALLGLFGICLAATVMASVLHLDVLMGIGFCIACVLAPAYATRQALLEVVAAPPVTFLLAVIIVQVFTAQGDSTHASVQSVLEGTLLALAAVAPWLFVGTVLCVVIAFRRGLLQCVRELRAGLRGEEGAGAAGD